MDEQLKQLLKTLKTHEQTVSMILGGLVLLLILVILGNSLISKPSIFSSQDGSLTEAGTDMSADDLNANGQKTHTVVAGDRLWSIAEQYYNDGFKWVEIAKANNIENPSVLEKDTQLIIPQIKAEAPSETTIASTQPTATSSDEKETELAKAGTYVIQKGDTLWDISVKAYNDGYQWPKVHEANRDKISNPDLIEEGTEITLPR